MALRTRNVRYAVIGLGHFAQSAVLPAFAHLRGSELTAICSSDPEKLHTLGARYGVTHRIGYEQYDALLRSDEIDAVYLTLPNSLHAQFALRAAEAGVHVLCEKPMAVTAADCRKMIDTARKHAVKLMIGYRLHFEAANLAAIETVRSGAIGTARLFDSTFTMQIQGGNTRLRAELGGGPIYDLGIYCINAARYLFRAEPIEACAFSAARSDDPRFAEVPEQVSALLRFPDERLARFSCGFGGAHVSRYEVVGSKGVLRVDPAYDYAGALAVELQSEERKSRRSFRKRDQIAAELRYFSECIQRNRDPEPSGSEGLADLVVIEAINASIASGRCEPISSIDAGQRPGPGQAAFVPPHGEPNLVHASPPSSR
jgi:glucose-fructose oxidoreductase